MCMQLLIAFTVLLGRVEWRGDPREAHRNYTSLCDLSIISDAEEGDSIVETESVSSEYTRSLLNIASVEQTGSVDSLPSAAIAEGSTRSHNLVGHNESQSSIQSFTQTSDSTNKGNKLYVTNLLGFVRMYVQHTCMNLFLNR